jgi:hypothetical protein
MIALVRTAQRLSRGFEPNAGRNPFEAASILPPDSPAQHADSTS